MSESLYQRSAENLLFQEVDSERLNRLMPEECEYDLGEFLLFAEREATALEVRRVWKYLIEGKKYKDIAEEEGVTIGTINSTLDDVRTRLEKSLLPPKWVELCPDWFLKGKTYDEAEEDLLDVLSRILTYEEERYFLLKHFRSMKSEQMAEFEGVTSGRPMRKFISRAEKKLSEYFDGTIELPWMNLLPEKFSGLNFDEAEDLILGQMSRILDEKEEAVVYQILFWGRTRQYVANLLGLNRNTVSIYLKDAMDKMIYHLSSL